MKILLQDESLNTFGTWKDRRSKYIVKKALAEGVSKLCLITSGNAGYALAKLAIPKSIDAVSIVDSNISNKIKDTLKNLCTDVIEVDLSKKILKTEEVISLSRVKEECGNIKRVHFSMKNKQETIIDLED